MAAAEPQSLMKGQLAMRTTLKYLLAIAIGAGGIFALLLAMEALPDGELWGITVLSSVLAYRACTKLGWLAIVFVPSFPFLLFMLELDQEHSERYPFSIAIAAWSVFAIAVVAGAWRWWKRLRNAAPRTQKL